jgi:CRISPR-associated endonuclease Cas2
MTRKQATRKKTPLTFPQRLRKLLEAGISDSNKPIDNESPSDPYSSFPDLSTRVRKIIGIANNPTRSATDMLFFVMYDVESNKVRRLIAKYLINKGCTRIQRSVFLADIDSAKYSQIRSDLTEVQQAYDNHDSILIVPISTDYLSSMKIIGKSIDIDIITKSKNTLFF